MVPNAVRVPRKSVQRVADRSKRWFVDRTDRRKDLPSRDRERPSSALRDAEVACIEHEGDDLESEALEVPPQQGPDCRSQERLDVLNDDDSWTQYLCPTHNFETEAIPRVARISFPESGEALTRRTCDEYVRPTAWARLPHVRDLDVITEILPIGFRRRSIQLHCAYKSESLGDECASEKSGPAEELSHGGSCVSDHLPSKRIGRPRPEPQSAYRAPIHAVRGGGFYPTCRLGAGSRLRASRSSGFRRRIYRGRGDLAQLAVREMPDVAVGGRPLIETWSADPGGERPALCAIRSVSTAPPSGYSERWNSGLDRRRPSESGCRAPPSRAERAPTATDIATAIGRLRPVLHAAAADARSDESEDRDSPEGEPGMQP